MQENSHVHGAPSDAAPVIGTPGRKRSHGRLIENIRKRGKVSIRHSAVSRPFARVRSGIRSGTTPHFAAWMADLDVSRTLHAIKLDALAESTSEEAATFAQLFVRGKIKNVLQLSKKEIEDLIPLVGGDVDGLLAVEKYLNARRVRLNWTAA